jgi:hypothetical protein
VVSDQEDACLFGTRESRDIGLDLTDLIDCVGADIDGDKTHRATLNVRLQQVAGDRLRELRDVEVLRGRVPDSVVTASVLVVPLQVAADVPTQISALAGAQAGFTPRPPRGWLGIALAKSTSRWWKQDKGTAAVAHVRGVGVGDGRRGPPPHRCARRRGR